MEQFAPLSMVIRCGVAVVKIDGPGKENVLNGAVIEAFGKLMEDVQNRGDINAILVMSAKHNSFIAGADVEMLKNAKSVQEATEMSQNGQRKFQQLEDSQIPIVAAIMGSCMGGGLELALACHYRIAVRSDRTAFSFPEVRLGLLPGAGGTQRLPRIVALPTALDMMLSGRSIDAQKAKQFGIIDVLLDPVLNEDGEVDGAKSLCYLEQTGVQAALRLATKTLKVDRCASLWQTAYQWIMSSSIVWNRFIKPSTISMIYSKGGNHYPATYAILKCIEDGVFRGPSIGYATEAEEFGQLTQSSQSKALIGLFNASTKCKKQRFGSPEPIRTVSIIGATELGIGLANITASKSIKVILIDQIHAANQDHSMKRIKKYFENAVSKRKIGATLASETIKNIVLTDSYDEIKCTDVVIMTPEFESSSQSYTDLLEKVELVVGSEVPIAVNSFGESLEQLCSKCKYPERILGIFYVMPVERVECAELIKHNKTNQKSIATVASLLQLQKKLMLSSTDANEKPGYYIVQCMLAAINELDRQICEGYLKNANDVDKLLSATGFMMNFAELSDAIGLDVINDVVSRFTTSNYHFKLDFIQKLVDSKKIGKKCGRGLYTYSNGQRNKKSNTQYDILSSKSECIIPKSEMNERDHQMRLVLAICNVALNCFHANIISSPMEGDVGCVFGMGFPAFLGGPFRFHDEHLQENADIINDRKNCLEFLQEALSDSNVKRFYD